MTSLLPAPAGRDEVARRRTFAIISHPDAGKTTLTEKFLLFSGAVQEAGAVKSRKQSRAAISDWMTLEKERGISISSTVLQFDHGPYRFNLLDTPGHADFSEDTFRTLCAADAAIMVLDAAKGLEPQTLKLFAVCRDRGLPILTFVNKCDRPTLPPLEILDQIEAQIGMRPVPLTWPVGDGRDFVGVVDRRTDELIRYERTAHGATIGAERRQPFATADRDGCSEDRWHAASEELELLDVDERDLDIDAFLAGTQTPVMFGSALTNFGVAMLLERFGELAPPPVSQPTREGPPRPVSDPFSALVFKVQANLDPNHRDRVAFLRVCSGQFQRGMTATLARTRKPYHLKYAHQVFARDREHLDDALPGDIVGVVNATGLSIGDTLYDPDGPPVEFPPIPTFSPERFVRVRNRDTSRYKQFRTGLRQLDEEGVVHVLRLPDVGDQAPILAGVGQLQFEVAAHRLAEEFGVDVTFEPLKWTIARRIPPGTEDALTGQRGTQVVHDRDGTALALFIGDLQLGWAERDHPDIEFAELGLRARKV